MNIIKVKYFNIIIIDLIEKKDNNNIARKEIKDMLGYGKNDSDKISKTRLNNISKASNFTVQDLYKNKNSYLKESNK
jgi:hypothetical protein